MDEQCNFNKVFVLKNKANTTVYDEFRTILSTTSTMQLVAMYLKPGQEIGMERHDYTTQFFIVHRGKCVFTVNGREIPGDPGDFVLVPPFTMHNVQADKKGYGCWLYTLYSPPEHPSCNENKSYKE